MEGNKMTRNVQEIIKELTLEEKVSLCSGKDFWNTEAIERLNIPSIMMTDGTWSEKTRRSFRSFRNQ